MENRLAGLRTGKPYRRGRERCSSRLRSVPCLRKSVHKLAGERGGVGEKNHVTTRPLNKSPNELLAQFHVYLIAWITTRFPPGHRHDPISIGLERVRIEVGCRILAQLVLEPVGRVGKSIFVLGGSGHVLPI